MKITILYDNCLSRPGLKTGWGFSSLIEAGSAPPILFDTGADGTALLYNMKELGIDPRLIGTIVISHSHGDHAGGLLKVLEKNKYADLYVPDSSVVKIKDGRKVIFVSKTLQISDGVFSTGELQGIEQSLVVKTATNNVVVITGCSHPGVGVILRAASRYGKVYGIVGGLHGFHDFSIMEEIPLICPCHCTQHISELRSLFPDQYVFCGAGLELEL